MNSRIARRSSLILVVLVGFLLVISMAHATGPTLPKGTVQVKPDSVERIGRVGETARALGLDSEVIIPDRPGVSLWQTFTEQGGGLNVFLNTAFPPNQVHAYINGRRIARGGGIVLSPRNLPTGSVVDPEQHFEWLTIVSGFFLPVGSHRVEIRIYLLPDLYWRFLFTFVVNPFDFWLEVCKSSETEVNLKYHVTAVGGDYPSYYEVAVYDGVTLLLSGSPDLEDGVVVLELASDDYAEISGRYLRTVLRDPRSGREIIKTLWYTYAPYLQLCGSERG